MAALHTPLTEQVHHGADTGAEVVLHVAEAAPEHGEDAAELFGQSLDQIGRDGQ